MRTHFVEVRDERGPSRSPHPRGQYDVASAVLKAVHAENARRRAGGETLGIAVAFPGMIGHVTFPMGVVRAFGSQDAIRALARELRAALQPVHRLVVVDEVEEIGAKRSRKVAAFVRDRRAERAVVGNSDRTLRRAQKLVMRRIARGEEPRKAPLTSGEREDARVNALAGAEPYIRSDVTLTSSSTGCTFTLTVAPVESSNGDGEGDVDSYGLSRRGATVGLPHF